jgi:predicted peroxiredoxin
MASLLFVIAHSTDDPDRVATALHAASEAADTGHDVALWLSGEGVRIGIRGVADVFRAPAARTPAESLEILRLRGATLYCSRPCLRKREFEDDALLDDAVPADPEDLATLVAEGRVPIPT